MHFGVQEHLTTVRRHWGKIALVMLVAVMVTGAVGFLSSKVYISQARILLLNSSPAERASRATVAEGRSGFSSPQDQVLTQVAILQSPALAEKLAIELGPERVLEEMAWRWDWLREMPARIKDNIVTRLYEFPMTEPLIAATGIKKPGSDGTGGGPPIEAARDKLIKGLQAAAVVKTDLFSVSFAAPSAEFAAEALDGMIDIYIEHMVELRRPLDTAAIAQKEAVRLERILGDAEEELRAFSDEYGILSIERQKDLLLDRWSRMQEELSQAEGKLLETVSKIDVIERDIAVLPRQESISVTTRPNPVVDRLQERLVQLQTELLRYVAGSSAAIRLRREIDTIASQLTEEAKAVSGQQTVGNSTLYLELTNRATVESAEKEALDARILFLRKELEALDIELRRVVSHELEYRQLDRTVAAREEAYRYALLKREETAIQASIAQTSLAQVVPVERADVPTRPAGPQRMRLLALGLIAGLLAGIGLSYALEFARRMISTADEAEIAIGLPVLAVTERYGFLSKRLKRTRLDIRRFATWVARQTVPDRGVRLLFAAPHRKTGQGMFVKEVAKSLQKQGMNVVTLRLILNERGTAKVVYKPAGQATDSHCDELVTVQAPAWEMQRSLRDVLAQIGQGRAPAPVIEPKEIDGEVDADAGEGSEAPAEKPVVKVEPVKTVVTLPVDSVVLIDAPCFARFPELASLTEFADRVVPVIEADKTRISEIHDLVEAIRMMDVDLPGVVLTKRRMTKSSWAFGWTASSQRRTWEQS